MAQLPGTISGTGTHKIKKKYASIAHPLNSGPADFYTGVISGTGSFQPALYIGPPAVHTTVSSRSGTLPCSPFLLCFTAFLGRSFLLLDLPFSSVPFFIFLACFALAVALVCVAGVGVLLFSRRQRSRHAHPLQDSLEPGENGITPRGHQKKAGRLGSVCFRPPQLR